MHFIVEQKLTQRLVKQLYFNFKIKKKKNIHGPIGVWFITEDPTPTTVPGIEESIKRLLNEWMNEWNVLSETWGDPGI